MREAAGAGPRESGRVDAAGSTRSSDERFGRGCQEVRGGRAVERGGRRLSWPSLRSGKAFPRLGSTARRALAELEIAIGLGDRNARGGGLAHFPPPSPSRPTAVSSASGFPARCTRGWRVRPRERGCPSTPSWSLASRRREARGRFRKNPQEESGPDGPPHPFLPTSSTSTPGLPIPSSSSLTLSTSSRPMALLCAAGFLSSCTASMRPGSL